MTPPASLRDRGAILLLSSYELGHRPLGTAWPAAFLERGGFAPRQRDLSQEAFDPAAVAAARLIVFAAPMHTALRLAIAAARRARGINPDARILFHGLYAWLNADLLLAGDADGVIGGEAETALVRVAEALERGGGLDAVPEVRTPLRAAPPVLSRPAFLPPDFGGLPPLSSYARLREGREEFPVAYVEATRGCLHLCRHCPIPPVYGGRLTVVPVEIVLEDIRRQVAAGARHVSFGDPDFLNGPGHALRVVRGVRAEFPALTFDCTAKVSHLVRHAALLPELGRLGCRFIVSAVESLSDAVLRHLDKGHTRADVFAALAAAREAGISLRPTFVAFTPWTTLDDYIEMLEFVEAEGLIDCVAPVQLTLRLLVPPGSLLRAEPALAPHLGTLDAAALSYRWTHPDPRMDALQREVSALAERAADDGEDAALTYYRIRGRALIARDGRTDFVPPDVDPERPIPARLTEPWFC